MIRILQFDLPDEAAAKLAEYQSAVDALGFYEVRVAAGKQQFETKNRRDNPTFKVVRDTLDKMCRGAKRCMYCEDSAAYQVEHFRPKIFIPSLFLRGVTISMLVAHAMNRRTVDSVLPLLRRV